MYLNKTVKLSERFLSHNAKISQDGDLKEGIVVDEKRIGNNRFILTVDDAEFGEWKAISTNVDIVPTTFH